MNASMGALIQQILPQITPSVEVLLRQMAQPMAPSLNSLINQLIPVKPSQASTGTVISNTGVIEAVVLSSSKLLGNSTALTPDSSQQFKIKINTDQQSLELTTKTPIPAGTRILLNIAQNNLATILSISDTKSNADGKLNIAGQVTNVINTTRPNQSGNSTNTALTAESKTAFPQQTNRTTIDQALRESLPQQQPLKLLLPLLQQVSQQPPQHWPKALTNNLNVLLGQFPSSDQAQQPKLLKQSIQNSGVFFEAKLAQLLAQKNTAAKQQTPASADKKIDSTNIKGDIKGLVQRIITQVDKASEPPPTTAKTTTTISTLATPTVETLKNIAPLYSAQQAMQADTNNIAINSNATNTNTSKDQATDILLRQLGQQLLASLARSQVNQLESLAVRQSNNPDPQAPVNSWALEIPIIHGKHTDNLELRIDQHEIEEEQESGQNTSKKLWTVMLAFDLHSSGKMNVELKILDQSVSATVWSEQENTYREVQQQVAGLKKNLEKVGVNVKKVECQLGLPAKSTMPIYQQLVDIRT